MEQVLLSNCGIYPGDELDLTVRLNVVLEQLKCHDSLILKFAPGKYHFYPNGAPKRLLYVSNHHDDAVKQIALLLQGFKNLTIDGSDSEFIFHTEIIPFYLKNCKNICIKNLSVDYARPTYSEGKILNVTEHTMDIEVDPIRYPWKVENKELYFYGENFQSPLRLWLEMDADRMAPMYETKDMLFYGEENGMHPSAETLSPNSFRLSLPQNEYFLKSSKVGNHLILRHHLRTHPGFYICDSQDINVKNISIFHTEGIAFMAERCENVQLQQFNVCRNLENPRIFTAAADATHFVNCYGKIEISHCLFENQLDDAVNIHGIYAKVKKVLDGHSLLIFLEHDMQKGVPIARIGDSIALMEADKLKPLLAFTCQNLTMINSDYFILRTEEEITQKLPEKCVVENLDLKPEVHIHDCIFRNNRARGILLTCLKAVVENCRFESAGAAIYLEGEACYWCESGCTEFIILRNNIFIACAYVSDWGNAPITVTPKVQMSEGWYFHKLLVVEGNTFLCFDRRLLWARGVGEIRWKDNEMKLVHPYPPLGDTMFDVENCGSCDLMQAVNGDGE